MISRGFVYIQGPDYRRKAAAPQRSESGPVNQTL